MVAYLKRIPAGIPGATSRNEHLTAEPQQFDAAFTAPASYGLPMGISANGKMRVLTTGDAATLLYGYLIRPYPGGTNIYASTLGSASPGGTVLAGGPCSIMRRGYMTIVLGFGTAVKGGGVYYRVVANARPVGTYEAAADGANTILLPGTFFDGAADTNGNVEIQYNI